MVGNNHANIVAIMKSDESAVALRRAAESARGPKIDIHVFDGTDIAGHDALKNGHEVLLVDVEPGNRGETDRLSRFIRDHHQSRPVIVTAANAGVEDVRRFMQLGAVDVLPQPIREVDLLVALDHAKRIQPSHAEAPTRMGSVVSFLKGGGGVGATTLAVQGGGMLVTGGKKNRPKVCVLDLDIQFGNAGLYLDVQSSVGLGDLLESPERMDPSFLSTAMSEHSSGLDVLTVPEPILPLESVSPEFVANLVDLARESYDYVLVDLPQAWTTWTYAALRQSDLIVLVSQLSVASVRQAKHQIDTLREQGLDDVPIRYVLNRHRPSGFGGSAQLRDAEKGLGHAFDDVIANNYDLVSEAINRGVMLAKVKRWSKTGKHIRQMMTNIRHTLAETGQKLGASPSN